MPKTEPIPKSGSGWRRGWKKGVRLGREYGYHFGRCEAVLRGTPNMPPGWWDVRMLYVTSGKGLPYSPLDQSIIEALGQLVRELIVLNPAQDLVTEALQKRPDIVLVLDGMHVPTERIVKLREAGIRTAIWLTDDPYYSDVTVQWVQPYDVVFTLELECVAFYQQNGCAAVHYLPFASNTSIFRPKIIPVDYRYDISFIGSAYWNRVAFFDQLAPYLAHKRVYISGIWWDRLTHYRELAKKIELNKWMNPEETAAYYNGAKIVINMHRSADDRSFNKNNQGIKAVSPNPRMFEISSCGTLQLTDIREDIARFYTPGTEIVTYENAEDLIAKIEYYLSHEEERRAMALNALRRTLQEHTYMQRMGHMLRLLFG
ncbi:CgeB family protein [Paenibacillus gyeongsangnamensis]